MDKTDKEYQELKDSVKLWVDVAIEEDLNSNPKESRNKPAKYAINALCAVVLAAVSVMTGIYFSQGSKCPEWVEVQSSYGEKKSVTLSDGSTIWLHNDSRILYPKEFVGRTRQVFTSGEVYADIAKDKRHPFVISSDGVNVKVKGTKFNYRAYNCSPKVELTLVEGAVEMSVNVLGNEKVIDIEAGTGIKFDTETGDIVRYTFNSDEYNSWIDNNSLYFNNLTLEEIALELGRTFGVSIKINSEKLKKSRFYATFLDAGSAEQILDALCATNMMNVMKQGEKTFTISESKL